MLGVAAAICVAPIAGADRMDTKIQAYAHRSVQIIALAQKRDADELSKLVSPKAEFSIGRGDVGMPFGTGVQGAIAAGQEIVGHPRFRFRDFGGLPPGPDDPCSAIKVEVQFLSPDESSVIPVTFSYDHGVLQSANGWHVYETVGDVDKDAR